MGRILIVEDEHVLAKNVRDKLRAIGHEAQVVHNCKDALARIAVLQPNVVVLDLRLPDGDGMSLLPRLREDCPSASVIIVTAHGNERIAVEAMKAGAYEYLTKPVDLEELQLVVGRALDHQQVSDNLGYLRSQEERKSGLESMIGVSDAVRALKETIQRLTQTRVLALSDPPTVLLTGETGVGKDLAARAIHYDGPRAKKPFIQVNCTALPATLFESELFGHMKGAFTSASQPKKGLFEVAEGGTIFLDEIGHLDAEMQAKLLHAIEHREIRPVGGTEMRPINVHIVAATNRDLDEAVEHGEFRRDLYHRLRVVSIHLPPLRERAGDVECLAQHFLQLHCKRFGLPDMRLGDDALAAMKRHAWRGNVRELSHTIESVILQAQGNVVRAEDLPFRRSEEAAVPESGFRIETSSGRSIFMDFETGSPTLDEVEHSILTAAFDYTGQNLSRAARILGITREALRYRLNKNVEKVET